MGDDPVQRRDRDLPHRRRPGQDLPVEALDVSACGAGGVAPVPRQDLHIPARVAVIRTRRDRAQSVERVQARLHHTRIQANSRSRQRCRHLSCRQVGHRSFKHIHDRDVLVGLGTHQISHNPPRIRHHLSSGEILLFLRHHSPSVLPRATFPARMWKVDAATDNRPENLGNPGSPLFVRDLNSSAAATSQRPPSARTLLIAYVEQVSPAGALTCPNWYPNKI